LKSVSAAVMCFFLLTQTSFRELKFVWVI
jgi:hypothetical protein